MARATGISFGAEGPIPNRRAPALKGPIPVQEALARLLAGSGLHAVRIGPTAYRLVPAPASPAPRQPPLPSPSPADPPAADIVVTALRRPLALPDVAASIAIVTPDMLSGGRAAGAGTDAVAAETPALSLTNVGQGRNRQFVRGIADSPFNGVAQGVVAIVLDGNRVTYDAPDPDLRLVDIARVEVLKGPQGPLYGTGALGGVYHLVSNRPQLDRISGQGESFVGATQGGSAGYGASATLNLPIARDRLGVRASGWASREPGWLDRNGRANTNRGDVIGGRLGLRWAPGADWTVDLTGLVQNMAIDDSQYQPRTGRIAEPHDNDFRTASLELNGRIGGAHLTISSSIVDHEVASTLDASAAAARLGFAAGPLAYRDERNYRVFDQEVRLSGAHWLAGLSWLSARTRIRGTGEPDAGAARTLVAFDRAADEIAAFGQLTLTLTARLRAEVGLRVFSARVEDERRQDSDGGASLTQSGWRLNPSFALLWSPSTDTRLFARVAQGGRSAGLGIATGGDARPYARDTLTAVELGVRHGVASGAFSVEAILFAADWRRLQADYLLPEGLIGTRNAGNAGLVGAEASIDWRPRPGWRLRLGALAQRARLRDGGPDLPDDRRLPTVPELAGSASLARTLRIGDWTGEARIGGRWQGPTRLSFDPGLDRKTGGYAVLNGRFELGRGRWRMSLAAGNLLNNRADSFAFGNPFSLPDGAQRTPLAPRTVTIGGVLAF